MKFPTIFLVRGGGHASKHPSSPPCATKTHFWPPEPSEGDASSASAQHLRSRDKEGGDFPRRAVDWRLRSRGRQWALRRDRAALSLSQTSAHILKGRLHQAGDQIFCSPSPEACRPLTQGKPAPGRNRRGYEAESAPYKVTADPGRGKDHPRPSSHPETSQGPGQRLGNLYTWDCTSADLYRQEVSSPGCGLLLRNGHLVGTGEASRQSLSQSPVLGRQDTSRVKPGGWGRGAGERSQSEAGRCTIVSDPVTRSGHDTQRCETLCASQTNGLSTCSAAPFLSQRQDPHTPHTPLHTHTHKLLIHSHSTHTHTNSSLTPHTHTHTLTYSSHTHTNSSHMPHNHTHTQPHTFLTHSHTPHSPTLSLSLTHTHTSTEPTAA